ncbi:MAG: IS110 family transposase [Intrasporangium sp.]|uniref:IS110 family transposase n=1 Tax=Intrasporangium sp. TaxID=1925024 RepID=UPI003F7FB2CA
MKEATTMVVVGADVHERTHTFVAVDQVGKQVGQLTVAATSTGHLKALGWARREFSEELTWAIEDCRHLSARLERDLLGAGQRVVRVPPKMMAEQRRVARTRGKSDPIDALAVARAFLREPTLPVASHDEVSREAKLLVDRRESLVNTRTRTINSLLWRVHELAAKLLGESAGITRSRGEAAFARHAGLAPIPVWSGNTAGRVRMTRSGNRQINCAIHRIAVTQLRLHESPGRAYYDKKLAEGKTKTEALRCLKRRLARTVFNLLTTDHHNRHTACLPAAA